MVDIDSLSDIIRDAKPGYLLLALVSHLLAFVLFSIRWWYLYNTLAPGTKYKTTVESYYLGLFCNNFLPTGMGGDIVRIIHLHKAGFNSHILISSTLLDRVIGLVSIVSMGLLALLVMPRLELSHQFVIAIIAFSVAIPLAILFMFSQYSLKLVNFFVQHIRFGRFSEFITKVVTTFQEYRNSRQKLLTTLLLSFLAQYLIVMCYMFIGYSLIIDLELVMYLTIVPIVFLATSLPISVGGLGIREGVVISLFTLFNVDTQSAIALSLIYFAVIVFLTLPGGLVLIKSSESRNELAKANKESITSLD